jgi:cyanoexosortase B
MPPTIPHPDRPSPARSWSDFAILGLLALLYVPLLLHWTHGWISKSISIEHEYFSHGLIGLPYAGYLVWQKRRVWTNLAGGVGAWRGLDRLAGGAIVLCSGWLYSSNLPEAVNLSLPLMLMGVCLWLKGLPGLRLMAFPLVFVWFSTPNELPYLIAPTTMPLQGFIAGTAGVILNILGFNVGVEGIHLFMNGRQVEVAPYCAGLKMLFTSIFVAVMLLHWTQLWRARSLAMGFLAGTVVFSVGINIIRNTTLTYFHGTGNDAAFRWLHEGWGGDCYSAISLGILVICINKLEDWWRNAEYHADHPEAPFDLIN